MKLAILADVHSNLEALTACLDHARAAGAEAFAFLGDLVGYGPDPAAVLDLVAAYANAGAVVVRGNHDAAVVTPGADTMHRVAEEAIVWTRARLEERHRAFLASLPLLVRRGDLVFVHSSAERPADWTYVTDPVHASASLRAAGTRYVFSGHVHEPMLYTLRSPIAPSPSSRCPASRSPSLPATSGSRSSAPPASRAMATPPRAMPCWIWRPSG